MNVWFSLRSMTPRASKMLRRWVCVLRVVVFITIACATLAQTPTVSQSPPPKGRELKPILDYISTAWDTLTRSMSDCQTLVDPKMKVAAVLYLPAGMETPPTVQKLSSDCHVQIEHLPVVIHH